MLPKEVSDAFKILEMSETSSDEELKAQYKKLAKQYHPDLTKDDGSKFKSINQAYQTIQDYRSNPSKFASAASPFYGTINIDDIFGQTFFNQEDDSVYRSRQRIHAPPNIHLNISFNDAILGTSREIKYDRYVKCVDCDGRGLKHSPNDCKNCNGFGQVVSNNGAITYTRSCQKCYGRGVKKSECKECHSNGSIQSELIGQVSIPPGISDGSTLRLQGAGHFSGKNMFGEMVGDVYVHVHVEKSDTMAMAGSDVVSHLSISLLEAMEGTKKEIETVYGKKEVVINEASKNHQEILIPKCGVKDTNGHHRVILDVEYPTYMPKLIKYMKKQEG